MLIPIKDNNVYTNVTDEPRTHIEANIHKMQTWENPSIYVSAVTHKKYDNGTSVTSGGHQIEKVPDVIQMGRRNEKKMKQTLQEEIADKSSKTWTVINNICQKYNYSIE